MVTNYKHIHLLSPSLANQIAAGEVIERPASVLKELLENSLDAGSTQIEINVEQGGTGLIRVQDNGSGICKEDLALALAPHATSKIETMGDLERITSYGFRGEALASIGAVSHFLLSSWVPEQEFGWSIHAEGRTATPKLKPVPKHPGTIIEVRDLFYNTPARRKFLRSDRTEMGYLEEIFKRVALSQPGVSFKFQQGDRLQKRLPICAGIEAETRRLTMLCGENFVEEAYYIQAESNGLILKGWLGSPKAMRSQADLQYFYVNGRIVRDKVVMHAIRQGYQEVMVSGRYPAYVLSFELDPASLDVNVHPTKHEVRFREARTTHAFLSYAIQEGLKQGKTGGTTSLKPEEVKDITLDLSFLNMEAETQEKKLVLSEALSAKLENKNQFENKSHEFTAKPLFLLGEELLLGKDSVGLVVIDIKMLRHTFIQEQLIAAYHQEGVSKRSLLMPKSLVIGNKVDSLESATIQWERLGFEMTVVGYDVILIRTVPTVFGPKVEDLEKLIPHLLTLSKIEDCADAIAHHIVEHYPLSEEEAKQFWGDIQGAEIVKESHKIQKHYKICSLERLKNFLRFEC